MMHSRKSHKLLYVTIFYIIHLIICEAVLRSAQVGDGISHYDRSCLALLEEYAAQTSNFTECFIEHARPITVCLNCVQQYLNVVRSYKNITKLEGDIPGEFCKAELMNVDRLEVIVDSFNYVEHLWKKALCSKCFKDRFVNYSTDMSNETKTMLTYLKITNTCIDNTNQTSHSHKKICDNCYGSYFELNDYYDNRGSYTNFCMDIIDAMNSTRFVWSVTLGCCTDRQKPETLFLMTVIVALSTPVLFYLLVWICAKRTPTRVINRERWTRRFLRMSINN